MDSYANKSNQAKSQSVAANNTSPLSSINPTPLFEDNRKESALQRKTQSTMQRAAANPIQPNNGPLQRQIIINAEPFTFDDATQKIHKATDAAVDVTPSDPAKAKAWAADPWKRQYDNAGEYTNHETGNPVKVGLFKELGLWYNLPFNPGTPFLLGENHATKVTQIMHESNRTGSILHESNGVMPIGTKNAEPKPNAALPFKKTAMESVIAKTLFGVSFLPGEKLIAAAPGADTIKEAPDTWITNYEAAAAGDKGVDKLKRPFYLDLNGKKVIQGVPGVAAYDPLNTMARVKPQFDTAVDDYILAKQADPTKQAAIQYFTQTKVELNDWWTAMNVVKNAHAADPADATIPNKIALIKPIADALLKRLKILFNLEYGAEIGAGEYAKRETEANKVLAGQDKMVRKGMAMRDLAMLTAIKEAAKNWGDHEMISMGEAHLKTLEAQIKAELPGIPIISKADFIAGSKNALP